MPDVGNYSEVSGVTSSPVYWKNTIMQFKAKRGKKFGKAEEKLGLKKHHLQFSHYFEVT